MSGKPDLDAIEAAARKLNPGRSEDHIKSVALDALSIIRALGITDEGREVGLREAAKLAEDYAGQFPAYPEFDATYNTVMEIRHMILATIPAKDA